MATDTVNFISSLHGEQRRRERGIDRRDLQEAIRHGTAVFQPPPRRPGREMQGRWKITWNDIVYITDYDKTTEITSWAIPLPLKEAPLSEGDLRKSKEMARRIRSGEQAITSHTILIVDQSGSMNTADVPGHRTRSRCVFYNIATEIISAPLLANMLSFTDVITIIQMRDEATIIVDAEPVSWQLYNVVVGLAAEAEATAHKKSRRHRRARGNGNFIPALKLAFEVASNSVQRYGTNIALLMFFLSDGRPSDHARLRICADSLSYLILDEMAVSVNRLPASLRPHFIFGSFGFANEYASDFWLLKSMAVEVACTGAVGIFRHGVDSRSLRAALLHVSKLLTTKISRLSSLIQQRPMETQFAHGGRGRVRDDLIQAAGKTSVHDMGTATTDFTQFEILRPVQRYALITKSTPPDKIEYKYWTKVPFMSPRATGIAKSETYLEKGAERVAFELREVDSFGSVTSQPLVWKENLRSDAPFMFSCMSCE